MISVLKRLFCCYLFIVYCCSFNVCGFRVRCLYCYTVLCVLFKFVINSLGKRERDRERELFLSLPHNAVVWYVGCDCRISWP